MGKGKRDQGIETAVIGGLPDAYARESGDVLAAVLANSRDSILLLTVDGIIEYASGGATVLLDCPVLDKAIGRPWIGFWPPDTRDKVIDAVEGAGSGNRTEFEAKTSPSDHEPCWWEVAISPVRDAGGAVTHLLAVATDVSGRKLVMRDERRRREEAEREASHAGAVAQEMRHRLKNQLAVVGAVAKLLARHSASALELAAKLQDKLIAIARAQDILISAHDTGLTAPHAVNEVLRASGAGDRVEVREIPDVDLPQESVQQLALILSELQTNALKYGALAQDGGRIELSGRLRDAVLELSWCERCATQISPSTQSNGGFQLIKRLGSAGRSQPAISWHDDGIQVDFYVRIAS